MHEWQWHWMSDGVGLVGFLFLLVLAVLWFLLPFAIFGTKDRLKLIIDELKKINTELVKINTELAARRSEDASALRRDELP
jgi:hypothetical protein